MAARFNDMSTASCGTESPELMSRWTQATCSRRVKQTIMKIEEMPRSRRKKQLMAARLVRRVPIRRRLGQKGGGR